MAGRGLLGVSIVALLFGGACGGGSDTLSKSEYIAAGDRLCQRFADRSADAMEGVETPGQLTAGLEKLIAEANKVETELAELSPPDDAKDVHTELLDSLRASTAKVREGADALEREDEESFEALLDEAGRLGTASDKAAKAYGFKVCGSESEQ